MKRLWIKHREPDPASGDATPSWAVQEVGGDPGTDYETPGRMHARAETDGHGLGAAGVPKEEAVGQSSGAVAWISGGVTARKGLARVAALAARTAAKKIAVTLPGKLEANTAQRAGAKEKTKRLRADKLPDARAREEAAKDALRGARGRFERLARHRKGYFHSPVLLVAIEAAVVAFDGGALYGPLKHAGFSGAVLVYVMLTVPALIAAVNHGAGVLAGAIGLKLGDEMKLKAAGVALAAIVVSLVCALLMLLFFRSGATAAHNAAIGQWANGNLTASPGQTLSPTWLGPAQIAGSFAAIVIVAFWTMALEGREVSGEIAVAKSRLDECEADRFQIEGEIEGSYEQETTLATLAAQMKATAAEANVDVEAHAEMVAAKLEVEDGLKEAVIGRLTTSYVYTRQIFANGEVVRVAMPTVTTRWGRRTPPPGDADGKPFRAPTAAPGEPPASPPGGSDDSSNGHHDVPPEERAGLI